MSKVFDGTQTFAVAAYGSRGKLLGHVYLRAGRATSAERAARPLHRMMGVRGSFQVSARPYSPLHDPAFRGYVRALGAQEGGATCSQAEG